ncbi:MAG: biotin/lipoyl-binding protein, partial [Candidatus Eremiobacteraeota bacterium]|nr:biotin/lipoyl-binding protein [Candidatus Eremiobacteraeota bacterium]
MEVRVPDIGDFKEVPVIEVLVKPGDTIKENDPLVTLESEKASMEVPAANAGVVKNVSVKVGDKVSEGSVLLTLDSADAPPPAESVVELKVPDIGDFKDVPVIEVSVIAGTRVEKDAPLVILE